VARVSIDDPSTMNVLGLFLASSLRRNLVERARPCRLRGSMTIDADGMRATIHFDDSGAVVSRTAGGGPRVVVSGPLPLLTDAIVRRRLLSLLRVRVKGNRLFALRAMGMLKP